MTIAPGSRVGVYEVGELLGSGGMGAVYRARDSRLGRDVAIKIIHPDLAADSDRVARFEREARLLASLSHPHIATIYGLEHAGDDRLVVLELVPGQSLDERLREGPLPVREALAVAVQIAAGMEAAHERGVIHRDLKPANIKITPSGTVKILDFGLAKALSMGEADMKTGAPTLTVSGTQAGVILGTAAYMSPEQARGREVDKRTDVWAFGCVCYDMLTGSTPFGAETMSDTIAAILTREPDWSRLPPDTPPAVVRLLHRCLQKDVQKRLRDIGDARLELEEALSDTSAGTAAQPQAIALRRESAARRFLLPGSAAVAGIALGALLFWALGSRVEPPPRAPAQFALTLSANQRLAGLDFPAVAISPRDTHIAFIASAGGDQQLFVRALNSLEATALAGTEGASSPFFSPDGQWIAFFASGALKKVPIAGGRVQTIADAPVGFGGAWAADNTIVFAPNNASELLRVSADGGSAQPATTLDTSKREFSHRWPEMLPDGKSVIFVAGSEGSWDDAVIALQEIGSKERRTIVQGGTSPRFSPTGHLLYARSGVLHAIPLDEKTGRATGSPVGDLARVAQSDDGAAQISVSRGGTLLVVPGSGHENGRSLVWVDREGNIQPLPAPPRAYSAPRLSPDGRTIAVTIGDDAEQVWTYDIAGNQLTQLTFDGGSAPVWGHDGSRIVFAARRDGALDLFSKALDGPGALERLTTGPDADLPHDWVPDRGVLFVEGATGNRDISLLAPDHSVRKLVTGSANETAPAASPDGRWLAYVSDESGEAEVYAASLENPDKRVQISEGGGTEPVWSTRGTEIYFRSGTRMLAASLRAGGATVTVQDRRVLFHGEFESGSAGRPAYDLSRDGTRFLMVRSAASEDTGRELRIFMGWKPR